jgi:hypothetical protein
MGVFFSEEVLVASSVEHTLRRVSSWLAGVDSETAAADALTAGGRVLTRAGFAGLGKVVEVRTARPWLRDAVTVIPLRWSATGPMGDLFPTLDANLEISAADAGQSRVALIGSYRPPLGPVGAVLDRAVLRRAGRVTIRRWLREAGAAVAATDDAQAAAPGPSDSAPTPPLSVWTSTDGRPDVGGLPSPG